MRSSHRCADDARSHRLAAIEDFYANSLSRHAHRLEHLFHVCHEPVRPTEINVAVARDAGCIENRLRQVTRSVEILSHLVVRTRRAVANIAAPMSQRRHQATNFGGKRMMLS